MNRLTSKEYEVMCCLWQYEDGMAFGEIHDYLNEHGKEIKKQTVNTHIMHLIQKGFAKAEGSERRRIYTPLISKKEYDGIIARTLVDDVFGGSLKNFITALTGGGTLSERDVKDLKAILKKRG